MQRPRLIMELDRVVSLVQRNRRPVLLAAVFTSIAGLNFLLFPTHDPALAWLGLLLLTLGVVLAALSTTVVPTAGGVPAPTLADRAINRLTERRRLVPFFPGVGGALVALDVAYNAFLSPTPQILSEDVIVLLLGGVLLAYGHIPSRYGRERDFVFLFFVVLSGILVVPLLLARLVIGNLDASVDVYSWTALAPETGAVLGLLGVMNSVHSVAGSTAPGISFTPIHLSGPVTVVITTACSGIYSFAIFAAAFFSFVLTEYERLNRRVWALLGLGFLTSYAANLLRMVIIVLVGFYSDTPETDLQNMLLAHSYAGWLIFLAWIAVFWAALFKFLAPGHEASEDKSSSRQRAPSATCGICGAPLSPSIPAIRCECGRVYHRGCITGSGNCASCGRPATAIASRPSGGA